MSISRRHLLASFAATAICAPHLPLANAATFKPEAPTRAAFPVGLYRLDAPIAELPGLVAFSPNQYAAMGGRQFEGETNYNAPTLNFLDHNWVVMLQTVGGKICKIAIHLVLGAAYDGNPVAKDVLSYCVDNLGKPAEQQTEQGARFVTWDTTDGNVILQTGETRGGFVIALFLTSSSIRNFKRLR
jgi:hypothetical protein